MLSPELIEKALTLTEKTMEDMEEVVTWPLFTDEKWETDWNYEGQFSIEKFCYYLLSPEFIEKYMPLLFPFDITVDYEWYLRHTATDFWEAIYEHQKWNPEPLEQLLSKI